MVQRNYVAQKVKIMPFGPQSEGAKIELQVFGSQAAIPMYLYLEREAAASWLPCKEPRSGQGALLQGALVAH